MKTKCEQPSLTPSNHFHSNRSQLKKKVFEYCSTNNRLAKKQTFWPLEILEFAENLEENTIPKKAKKAK